MGPKFQFLEKVFPTIFFTYNLCFTTLHVDWSQKIDKNFFAPFFKKFYKLLSPYGTKISIFVKRNSDKIFFTSYCPPMGPKFQFLKKVYPTIFFTHKMCFTTFHVDWSQKIDKNFFALFFKKFYKLLSPYGTKISIFEKSVSDDFFHLQNMFHNISRWLKPKNRQKLFRTNSKFFTIYCPPMEPKFQLLKKVFPTIFFTYKTCFTTFHIDWSQKIDKNFFEPFFKKFYKLLSPYGTKISIFGKSVSDNFFHLQNKFHNISRWLKPKNRQKLFRTNSKFFTIYCPPMEPKFQLLKKVFPTIFFTYKTCFTTLHVDWSQKVDKNCFEPIFQNFLQVIVHLWDQNFNFWKKCYPTILFTHKMCFTTFHVDWSQKIDKNFFAPFFKKFYKLLSPYGTKISIFVKRNSDKIFLQVIVPLWDQNFNFWKKFFRQFFSLTIYVSQHFTLIEAKKSTKIFSHHFSKNFTSYCPPMGPKFQFL